MNPYHPEVKLAMKQHGRIPVAEANVKKALRELATQYEELTARQEVIDAPAQGKVMKALFKGRILDFGQTPWTQEKPTLFGRQK